MPYGAIPGTAKLAAKEAVTGATTLEGLLTGNGVGVVRQARVWLGQGAGGEGPGGSRSCGVSHVEPVEPVESGENKGQDLTEWEILSVRASEVEERPLRWLWRGRIPLGASPLGAITMLDGDPGLGKSLVTLDLAGRGVAGPPAERAENRNMRTGLVERLWLFRGQL